MVSNGEKWGRIFSVADTSRHKKGFTVYKVISMLYPESCPDAITKITVWKRYNDFKKLHRQIRSLHKKLQLRSNIPNLPRASFFKRFDESVIQQRIKSILEFLEFVGSQPELFTSNEFVSFFKTSHLPNEQCDGNINALRSKLEVPNDPEYTFAAENSDSEHTFSDTDSLSTLSSNLSVSIQVSDLLVDPLSRTNNPPKAIFKSDSISTHSRLSKTSSSDSLGSYTIVENIKDHYYPTPPNTPGSLETDSNYVLEASRHINAAVNFEAAKKYDEAFASYKIGIDILLRNVKDEKDVDRRTMVRHKTEKYLLRAEKIYNVHLSPEMKNLQQLVNSEIKSVPEPTLSDLHKYKVVKIISSGMLVLHSGIQQQFFVKVIQKMTNFKKQDLILPEKVPYMVKLHNHFECENAIFLILEYCTATHLRDYVKQSPSSTDISATPRADSPERSHSESDSEQSYSDFILEYQLNKSKLESQSSDSSQFRNPKPSTSKTENIGCEQLEPSLPECESFETVFSEDVDDANEDSVCGEDTFEVIRNKREMYSRTTSDVSFLDELECAERTVVSLEVVRKWAAQLLLSLEKLHLQGVVCCDLHTRNILIDEKGDLILTYMCNVNGFCEKIVNSSADFRAPETFGYELVSQAVDWWSYGAILYELLVGMPLQSIHPEGLRTHTPLKVPRYVSPEGRSLLSQLLTSDPRRRLGCGVNGVEDIKSHPFFASVLWETMVPC